MEWLRLCMVVWKSLYQAPRANFSDRLPRSYCLIAPSVEGDENVGDWTGRVVLIRYFEYQIARPSLPLERRRVGELLDGLETPDRPGRLGA